MNIREARSVSSKGSRVPSYSNLPVFKPKALNIYRNLFEFDYDEVSAGSYDKIRKKLWFRVKCFTVPIFV